MINTIRELHYEFKLQYNKLDSNHKKDLSPLEIDSLLNYAQWEYIEIFYSGENVKKYKLGFEVTQQRIDMLSNLVIGKKQPSLIPDNILANNCYEFYLDTTEGQLVEEYIHFVRASVQTNCGVINVEVERHNDLNMLLCDTYKKPSKKWKRLIAVIEASTNPNVESSLYVYSEDDFIIESLNLEYLKKPRDVFFGGYNSVKYNDCISKGIGIPTCQSQFYFSTTTPVDSEISSNYQYMLVNIATQEIARRLEDINRFQLKQEKINTIS